VALASFNKFFSEPFFFIRSFFMRLSHIAFAAAALLAGTTQAQAADYTIDGTHTFATFEIGHFGTTTNRGRFDKKRRQA